MNTPLSSENRTCSHCDGKGYISVDLAMERFRNRIRFWTMTVCLLLCLGYEGFMVAHRHFDIAGWFITFVIALAVYAEWRGAYD